MILVIPTKNRYLIADFVTPPGVCHLAGIDGVAAWAEMMQNEAQTGTFPATASFKMSPNFPRDLKLADVLANRNSFLVVSEKLKDFLTAEDLLAHNEVHPVAIVNHRGRTEKAPYFIIHQIDDPQCVDEKKTEGEKSSIMPDQYAELERLVLDEEKIAADYAIFRAAEFRDMVLFRSDAAAKIEQAGFTGIEFHDLAEFSDF